MSIDDRHLRLGVSVDKMQMFSALQATTDTRSLKVRNFFLEQEHRSAPTMDFFFLKTRVRLALQKISYRPTQEKIYKEIFRNRQRIFSNQIRSIILLEGSNKIIGQRDFFQRRPAI